jgi:hypothetical protein
MSDATTALEDKEAIRDAIHNYCRAIDRLDRQLLVDKVFHSDAVLRYGTLEGSVAEFCDYAFGFLGTLESTMHAVSNCMIELHGEVGWAETYVISYHFGAKDPDSGNPIDLIVGCRYLDHFEKRSGLWRITRRHLIFEWNQNLPASGRWDGQFYGSFFPRGIRGKADLSYSMRL